MTTARPCGPHGIPEQPAAEPALAAGDADEFTEHRVSAASRPARTALAG